MTPPRPHPRPMRAARAAATSCRVGHVVKACRVGHGARACRVGHAVKARVGSRAAKARVGSRVAQVRTTCRTLCRVIALSLAAGPLAACQMDAGQMDAGARAQPQTPPGTMRAGAPAFPAPQQARPEPGTDVIMPMKPPGDPDIAVREEYDAAVAKNTRAAYDLFLARHPRSPLAADVKRRVQALN